MSHLFAEKTHEPTPYRRQAARRQGPSARSSELVGAFVVGGFILFSPLFVEPIWQLSMQLLRDSFALGIPSSNVTSAGDVDVMTLFRPAVMSLGPILLALGSGIFLLAVLANVLQRSVGWKPDRIALDLARLNPTSRVHDWLSIRRLLMGWTSLTRFLMTLPLVIGWLWTQRESIAQLSLMETSELANHFVSIGTEAMLVATCCVGLWAGLDYAIQWWTRERSLRMTPEEIRDEIRQRDGNPQLRIQRRARHAELTTGQTAIARADRLHDS